MVLSGASQLSELKLKEPGSKGGSMSKTSPRHSTLMPIVPMKTAFKSGQGNERRFHVMAKPGGAKCNIDCQY